jgi:hypothetical protein
MNGPQLFSGPELGNRAEPRAITSATLKVETHGRIWSSTEAQRFIERCTAVRGEETNIIRIGHIAKPREQLLDAGPRQSQSAVLRVCHYVGQLATHARRIRRRRCVSGHLAKGHRHKRTVGCLCDKSGNVQGRELVGESLPSFSEPKRVSVADLDLHSLEHHRAQPGKRCRVRADGAPNRDLHTPDSSM